ncbi:MAG TPA: aspartate/glutamate racemase family protein [Alphaproteobacteria bacterium]|nr:aspartate/glutamate racemase family protein [Alphaproteobacteria bacterium]
MHLPFELDAGVCARAAIGLMVLATDHTIEHEWRKMLALDGVAFYESRLYNSTEINPDTLRAMEGLLKDAAAVIRPGERLDVMAYGCTSGSMVMGEETVFARIREARPGIACTTPITAALAAFGTLGVRRIALLTPYIDEINQMMRRYIEARGVAVPVMGSFNHSIDNEVARITPASIEAAALELGRHPGVDAVFVSCTSLRVAEHVEAFEAKLGKPVTSSNHAMAWHALRLAGYKEAVPGFGRLLRL